MDARGKFVSAVDHGGSWTAYIAYPPEIARYLVFKGSVAVKESVLLSRISLKITLKSPSFQKPGKLTTFPICSRAMK